MGTKYLGPRELHLVHTSVYLGCQLLHYCTITRKKKKKKKRVGRDGKLWREFQRLNRPGRMGMVGENYYWHRIELNRIETNQFWVATEEEKDMGGRRETGGCQLSLLTPELSGSRGHNFYFTNICYFWLLPPIFF